MNYEEYIKSTNFKNLDPMSAISPMLRDWLNRAGYCSVTYPLVYGGESGPSLAFILRGYNSADVLPSYVPHACYQVWEKYYPEMIHAFRASPARLGDYLVYPWVNQDNDGCCTTDVINNRWLVIVNHNQEYYPDGDIHVFDTWHSNTEIAWEDLLD